MTKEHQSTFRPLLERAARPRPARAAGFCALVLVVGGCASAGSAPELTTATTPLPGSSAPTSTGVSARPASETFAPGTSMPPRAAVASSGSAAASTPAAYTLTEEEKELSCKKLTGRMQVRILQLRDWESQTKPSSLAQTMQKTVSALWPGDPGTSISDERYVRDRAQLEAYNKELAAKNCKTFDLDQELGAHPTAHTPEPKR